MQPLGLSTGWVGLGLGSTPIRPNQIKWTNFQPVADWEDDWFRRVGISTSGSRIGRSQDLENRENPARKRWKSAKILWDLTRSSEISPELTKISTRSGEISPDLAKKKISKLVGFIK